MKQELKLKLKKFLKTFLQWAAIIVGILVVAKVASEALSPRKSKTVEDAKDVIENTKLKIDYLETEKDEIEDEHREILANKKERDKRAKNYFSGL